MTAIAVSSNFLLRRDHILVKGRVKEYTVEINDYNVTTIYVPVSDEVVIMFTDHDVPVGWLRWDGEKWEGEGEYSYTELYDAEGDLLLYHIASMRDGDTLRVRSLEAKRWVVEIKRFKRDELDEWSLTLRVGRRVANRARIQKKPGEVEEWIHEYLGQRVEVIQG